MYPEVFRGVLRSRDRKRCSATRGCPLTSRTRAGKVYDSTWPRQRSTAGSGPVVTLATDEIQNVWMVLACGLQSQRATRVREERRMYREAWRVHAVAVLGFFAAIAAAIEAGRQGDGIKATLLVLAALACLGILVAPLWLRRWAKRHNGPPGRHASGRVKD
jgi:hypothetical protein